MWSGRRVTEARFLTDDKREKGLYMKPGCEANKCKQCNPVDE